MDNDVTSEVLTGGIQTLLCFFIELHFVIRLYEFALTIEAFRPCKTMVRFYQATQCHVSEDTTLHELHYGELLTFWHPSFTFKF
jgi:hypothetical protein